MNSLSSLAVQGTSALLSFHQSLPEGKTTPLDLSNQDHRKHAELMLNAAGRNSDAYPHLYNALNAGSSNGDTGDQDSVHLVDSGQTASGKATATVWACSGGNNVVSGGHLLLFDADSGQLLAQGENTAVRSGFVICPTRSEIASPAGKKLSILYLGHTTTEDGSTRFFSYANTVDVGTTGITVKIQDPRVKVSTDGQIHIGVGRTGGYPTSDYIYTEQQNYDNPWPIVPFFGNVPLSGIIDLPRLTATNIFTQVFVQKAAGYAVPLERDKQFTTDAKFVGAFSLGTAPNILQFNFPYDGFGHTGTKSLVYTSTSFGSEIVSYFYFAFFSIPLKGGGYAPPFYVCSKDLPNEPSINCTKIANLYFWWHCLAHGTMVTLADGSQKPIEEITQDDRVKTSDGNSLGVYGTVQGMHSSSGEQKEDGIYKVTTTNGKNFIATGEHMVFATAGKCRSVHELVAGDSILTEDGPSVVQSNEAIAHEGMFYALALGHEEEQAANNFPKNMAGYYAAGVLQADQNAMRVQTAAKYKDLNQMLPLIKPELHKDYTSALNDMRYK